MTAMPFTLYEWSYDLLIPLFLRIIRVGVKFSFLEPYPSLGHTRLLNLEKIISSTSFLQSSSSQKQRPTLSDIGNRGSQGRPILRQRTALCSSSSSATCAMMTELWWLCDVTNNDWLEAASCIPHDDKVVFLQLAKLDWVACCFRKLPSLFS